MPHPDIFRVRHMGYCHLTRLYRSTCWRLGAHRRLHVSPGSSRYPGCHFTSWLWTTLKGQVVHPREFTPTHASVRVSRTRGSATHHTPSVPDFDHIGVCRSSAFISRSDSRLGPCHASPGMTPCLIMIERPPCALLATRRSLRRFSDCSELTQLLCVLATTLRPLPSLSGHFTG